MSSRSARRSATCSRRPCGSCRTRWQARQCRRRLDRLHASLRPGGARLHVVPHGRGGAGQARDGADGGRRMNAKLVTGALLHGAHAAGDRARISRASRPARRARWSCRRRRSRDCDRLGTRRRRSRLTSLVGRRSHVAVRDHAAADARRTLGEMGPIRRRQLLHDALRLPNARPESLASRSTSRTRDRRWLGLPPPNGSQQSLDSDTERSISASPASTTDVYGIAWWPTHDAGRWS